MQAPLRCGSTCVAVLALLFGPSARADGDPRHRQCIIDGFFDDWGGVSTAFVDATGDHGAGAIDLQSVWIANDDRFVYLRFQTGNLTSIQNSSLRIFFDTDDNPATGYAVGSMGSDLALLLPERTWVEQTDSQFSAAAIGHAAVESVVGPTYAGAEFELRLRRGAIFPIRGTPMFDSPTFSVVLEGPTDRAPDAPAGHSYAFADGALPDDPEASIQRACPSDLRIVTWNMLWDGLFTRTPIFSRILQALQPDIICFEEITRSATELTTTLDAILPLPEGGSWNVYRGSTNAIASPFPLSLTGSETTPPTNWGQAMALVDLPDAHYPRDIYVICSHYKCCGTLGGPEDAKRQRHSDANVNWLRDARTPDGYITLPPETPMLITGDLNMVGSPEPLFTLITGDILDEATFGPDAPPDWNGGPLRVLVPLHNAGPAAYTWRNDDSDFMPGRLDFTLFTGSVLTPGRSFLLNTLDMSAESLAAAGLLSTDTSLASDHLPLVLDLRQTQAADVDRDGDLDGADVAAFVQILLGTDADACTGNACDLDRSGRVDGRDIELFVSFFLYP